MAKMKSIENGKTANKDYMNFISFELPGISNNSDSIYVGGIGKDIKILGDIRNYRLISDEGNDPQYRIGRENWYIDSDGYSFFNDIKTDGFYCDNNGSFSNIVARGCMDVKDTLYVGNRDNEDARYITFTDRKINFGKNGQYIDAYGDALTLCAGNGSDDNYISLYNTDHLTMHSNNTLIETTSQITLKSTKTYIEDSNGTTLLQTGTNMIKLRTSNGFNITVKDTTITVAGNNNKITLLNNEGKTSLIDLTTKKLTVSDALMFDYVNNEGDYQELIQFNISDTHDKPTLQFKHSTDNDFIELAGENIIFEVNAIESSSYIKANKLTSSTTIESMGRLYADSGLEIGKNTSAKGELYLYNYYKNGSTTYTGYTKVYPMNGSSTANYSLQLPATDGVLSTYARSSYSPKWLNTNNELTFGINGLQYFNISGTKQTGTTGTASADDAKTNNTPTSEWYHILRMNHGNTNGYYGDLALSINGNGGLYWRRVTAGNSYGWVRELDSLNYTEYVPKKDGTGATGTWGISISGNAATATSASKWTTSRTLTLGSDLSGTVTFDGSGNITLNATIYSSKATSGNKNNYPYRRIASLSTITGSYSDRTALLYLTQDYNGGKFGIIRISLITNNSSLVSGVEAKWLVRVGFSTDDIKIGLYNVFGATYADCFLKLSGTYASTTIRALEGTRGSIGRTWTLVDSSEVNDTTSSDKLTSTECYATIETAGTELHSQSYTNIVPATDEGIVNKANYVTTGDNKSILTSNGSTSTWTRDINPSSVTTKYIYGDTGVNIQSTSTQFEMGSGDSYNYIKVPTDISGQFIVGSVDNSFQERGISQEKYAYQNSSNKFGGTIWLGNPDNPSYVNIVEDLEGLYTNDQDDGTYKFSTGWNISREGYAEFSSINTNDLDVYGDISCDGNINCDGYYNGKIKNINTNSGIYHIAFVESDSSYLYINKVGSIEFKMSQGTTTAKGTAILGIGNNMNSTTANNTQGYIEIYGSNTGYTSFYSANTSTSNYDIKLPANSGTVALTSDIKLNGTAVNNSTFYAPTSAPTEGYFLVGGSSGTPVWNNFIQIHHATSMSGDYVILNKIIRNPVEDADEIMCSIDPSNGHAMFGRLDISCDTSGDTTDSEYIMFHRGYDSSDIMKKSAYGNVGEFTRLIASNTATTTKSSYPIAYLQPKSGTLALISDIPTYTFVTSKPTTANDNTLYFIAE
jgi:predicted nucleic-acid-binding Zn-ribbon protein